MIVWRSSEDSPKDSLRRSQKSEVRILLRLSSVTCLLFSILFLCSGYLSAKQATAAISRQENAGETPQYKIFPLINISADQGAKFLAEVKIGTVSRFPGGSNAMLITAEPSELIKATSILALVDAKEQFAIRMISSAAGLDNLPSNEQIASKVGNISVGTFSAPPAPVFRQKDAGVARAIVDIHDNALVVVAPVSQIERIVSVIEGRPIPPAPKGEVRGKAIEQPTVPGTPAVRRPPSGVAESTVDYREPTGPGQPPTEQTVIEPRQPGEDIPLAAEMDGGAERYAPAPIHDGDEILKLNLPDKLEIIDLLGLVGEYLGLDFMYDPGQIGGIVTLKLHGKLRGDLRVKDLYPLLESVLKFRGFAMTRKGNLVTITLIDQALDNDPLLMTDEMGTVEQGDVVVTRVFQLQYIDITSAQNFLTSMRLATPAAVTPIAETGTLVVTGYAYRMPRIEELLEIIDRPGEPKEFRFRQLKFTMAKTLASKVKTLSEQLGTVSITITAPTQPAPARGRRPRGRPVPPATSTPTPTKPTVYLDADERTNRILMIGLAEQLDAVDALIDSLDVAQQDLRNMKLYKIKHVDAEEARKKLQELGIIGGGRTTTPSRITSPARTAKPPGARPQAGGQVTETTEGLVEEPQVVVIEMTNSLLVNATPEQHVQIQQILAYVDSRTEEEEIPYKVYPLENQRPEDLASILNQLIREIVSDKEGKVQFVRKTDEEIAIIPDENTFSLIVYASKKNQEWIKSLIEQLDKRRPQVLIDVTLVEISEADAFDYDLNLVSKLPSFAVGGTMAKLPALLAPEGGFPFHQIFEATSTLGDASPSKGFYADRHIQALLSLMEKKGYGRVLAKPRILVNDNEQGHIDTTNTIYVSRSSQSVTPTGEPVVSTSYTFDQFPSGITLDITPHISEGKLLRLEIRMTRSSQLAPESGILENQPPPNKSENNIDTIVTVPDKSTIILGGITTLEQTKDNWKVPLFGDIPVVGGLFRKIGNNSRQSKLYIFVKADILRPAKGDEGLPDLEQISERNRLAFEKYEEKFQKYRDWPGIEPKPLDPLRVLEIE